MIFNMLCKNILRSGIVLTIILLNHNVNGKFEDGCFKVRFYWKSLTSYDKVYAPSNSLNMSLQCDTGSHIHILSITYSIPRQYNDYCKEVDFKTDDGRNCYTWTRPKCYCCSKPDPSAEENKICERSSPDVTDLINQCKVHSQSCMVNISAFNMKVICSTYIDYEDECDVEPNKCLSRWAKVKYECEPDMVTDIATTVASMNMDIDNGTNTTYGTMLTTNQSEMAIQDWVIGVIIAVVIFIILVFITLTVILCCRKNKDREKANAAEMELENVQKSQTTYSQRKPDYAVVNKHKKKKKNPQAVKVSFHKNNENQNETMLLQHQNSDGTNGKLVKSDKNNSVVDFVENNYYETGLNKNENIYQNEDVYYATPTSPAVSSSNSYPIGKRQNSEHDSTYSSPKTPSIKVADPTFNEDTMSNPNYAENEPNSQNIYYATPTSPTGELVNNNYYERSSVNKPNSVQCVEEIEYSTPKSPPIKLEENKYRESNNSDKDSVYSTPKSPPCEFVDDNSYGGDVDGKIDDCVYVNQEFNPKSSVPSSNHGKVQNLDKANDSKEGFTQGKSSDNYDKEGNYVYTYGHFKLEGRERKPMN